MLSTFLCQGIIINSIYMIKILRAQPLSKKRDQSAGLTFFIDS